MKIVLLEVGEPRESLSWTAWVDDQGRFAAPSVGLVSLASLVRDNDEVEIVDEKTSGPVDTLDADVVGISFKTMYAERAYEIADGLRAKGIRVILGGIHASLMPVEAGEHADVVAIGEGEAIWPTILNDIESGNYKRLYKAPTPPAALTNLPRQRFELLQHDRYMVHSLQSARGCSFDCEFCPTRAIFGEGYRLRNVDSVVKDVVQFVNIGDKPIFFSDNVFGAGDTHFINELTQRLRSTTDNYIVGCDYQMTTPELAKMLANNGCRLVILNLTGRKAPEELAAIQAVHSAGAALAGYFMLGFEEDTPDVFQGVIDLVRENDIVCAMMSVLSPYPGTPMGIRLDEEERIFCKDNKLLDHSHVLFRPAHMTAEQLQEGYKYVCKELGELCHFKSAVDWLNNNR